MTRHCIAGLAILIPVLLGSLGCAPRVRVISSPGPQDQGIRYYRPKPYLKVVPAEIKVGKEASRIEPSLVTVSLEYLPDFSEEYAIEMRPGLGLANVSIKLEDGWNLTEISQELDSQTDENISAAGDVIKALTGFVPTANDDAETTRFTVAATDVPLGYYESVIGCGPDGRKRLYGFRYLGFLPYESCPTNMGGGQRICCGDPLTPLYGLTFEGGRMVFKPLGAMRADAVERESSLAPTSAVGEPSALGTTGPAAAMATAADRSQLAADVEGQLLSALRQQFPATERVSVEWSTQGEALLLETQIFLGAGGDADAVRRAAVDMLGQISQGQFLYHVAIQ